MKSKTYISSVALFIIVFFSCSKKITSVSNDPSISVRINAFSDQIEGARVRITNEDYKTIWSDTIINNKLSTDVRVPKEGFYRIMMQGKKPGIKGSKISFSRSIYLSNHRKYEVGRGVYDTARMIMPVIKSNTAIQNLLTEYEEGYYEIDDVLSEELKQKQKFADSLYYKKLMSEYRIAWIDYIHFLLHKNKTLQKYTLDFAITHPNSIVSAYQLKDFTDFRNNYDLCSALYWHLGPEIRNSRYAKDYLERMNAAAFLLDGKTFPAIVAHDLQGKDYQSNFEKYTLTLVNFWMPNERVSREEMPGLIPLYNYYKDNGFNIISVALTKDTILWKKAIKQDGFIWPQHYLDGADIRRSVNAKRLDIHYVPQNYLIDQGGKIITKNIEIDSLAVLLKKM